MQHTGRACRVYRTVEGVLEDEGSMGGILPLRHEEFTRGLVVRERLFYGLRIIDRIAFVFSDKRVFFPRSKHRNLKCQSRSTIFFPFLSQLANFSLGAPAAVGTSDGQR